MIFDLEMILVQNLTMRNLVMKISIFRYDNKLEIDIYRKYAVTYRFITLMILIINCPIQIFLIHKLVICPFNSEKYNKELRIVNTMGRFFIECILGSGTEDFTT